MLDRINKIFSDCIDTIIRSAEDLPVFIINAANMIVNVLVGDGKILVCGNGSGIHDAQNFATKLLYRYERERPSLPAIALASDYLALNIKDSNYNEIFARQIKAFGTSDDLLLVISVDSDSSSLVQAIQAAHFKEMSIIVISGNDGGNVSRLLQQDDIEICIPSQVSARTQEMQRLVLHCLCDLIDEHLFGQLD